MGRVKNPGIIIVLILTLVPIVLWIFVAPLKIRFNGYSAILTSLGQIFGLAGTILFALNLILATKHRFLEKIFFGLNQAYVKHHLIGILAFIFLLIHPLVLMIKYLAVSVVLAAQFLLPQASDLTKTWGIISLLIMMVLLVLTLYLRPKYNIWKITHKFLGLAFFFASLHIYFVSSDVSRSSALRYYMLFFIALGFLAIIYRTVLGLGKKWNYQVKKITEVVDNSVYEIDLEPLALEMPYHAGQFVFVSFLNKKISDESHPFSLASNPKDKYLKIVVKSLGDYTAKMKNISLGTTAKILGPFGKFNYHNFSKNQIWVAGGIGITPFLGMARELASKKNCQVQLIYTVNKKEEAVYANEFENLAKNKILQFSLFEATKQGFLSAKLIKEIANGLDNKDILICGPPPMMKALKEQLVEMGVNPSKIHSEDFNL